PRRSEAGLLGQYGRCSGPFRSAGEWTNRNVVVAYAAAERREGVMRASRVLCASIAAIGVLGAQAVWAQENAQTLQAQIDQLKHDFEAMKQQYGDRLTALEAKMAALPPQPEQPAAAVATPTPINPAPPAAAEPAQAAAPQPQPT